MHLSFYCCEKHLRNFLLFSRCIKFATNIALKANDVSTDLIHCFWHFLVCPYKFLSLRLIYIQDKYQIIQSKILLITFNYYLISVFQANKHKSFMTKRFVTVWTFVIQSWSLQLKLVCLEIIFLFYYNIVDY